MDYIKWKRRIAMCGVMLLLLPPALLLALVDGLVDYRQENEIPVEIKYPLSEVAEDQAVLVQQNGLLGIMPSGTVCDLVVNKKGRWKVIDYTKRNVQELSEREDTCAGFYDAILRDDSIPWQKKRIGMNPALLERALNMPEVEIEKGEYPWAYYRPVYRRRPVKTAYCLIDNSPERQRIYYGTGTPKKGDYTPLYIQCKMKQLYTLGDQALEKQRAVRE